MNQIRTPPALREKTRQMLITQMQEQAHAPHNVQEPEQESTQSLPELQMNISTKAKTQKTKIMQLRWGLSAVAAAALALIVGISIWMNTSHDDSIILTNLIYNEHTEAVVLQNGELNFTNLTSGDLEPPIRLAVNFPLRQNLPLEEYMHLLPADIPYELSEPEGGIVAYFDDPTGEAVAVLGRAFFHLDSGGMLTVSFSDNSSLLYIPLEGDNSEIAEVPVGVGFLEADGIYYGTFVMKEFTFLLTAEGIEQRQFIYLLVHFITN